MGHPPLNSMKIFAYQIRPAICGGKDTTKVEGLARIRAIDQGSELRICRTSGFTKVNLRDYRSKLATIWQKVWRSRS